MAKTTGYTGTAKSLHWLILALLIAQFVFAWTMPDIGRNTPVTTLISLHFTFGILILAVAVVRLVWRRDPRRAGAGRRPAAVADCNPLASCIGCSICCCSWCRCSAGSTPPSAACRSSCSASNCRNWSRRARRAGAGPATCTGCWRIIVLLALVGLHVAAALYHYFVRRDGVLQRMLPGCYS